MKLLPTERTERAERAGRPDAPGRLAWLAVGLWLVGCTVLMWVFNPITPMDLAEVCRQVVKP